MDERAGSTAKSHLRLARAPQLYDEDVLEWSERQARLLRQHAAEMHGNPRTSQGDFAEAPDWANIIEEIESVGRSELNAVRSLLRQAFVQDLKCEAWPLVPQVPHWRAEALRFRADAADAASPSMLDRVDVPKLYRDARRLLPDSVDGQAPLPVPDACPVTLGELLDVEG